MFIVELFIIVKRGKKPKCPSRNKWIKLWYMYVYIYIHTHIYIHIPYMYIHICMSIYIIEYCLAIKRNEILPFASANMDIEGIMLSEVSQRKTTTV